MSKYEVGQKLYNRGDMANSPGWYVITKKVEPGKYNPMMYHIEEINGNRTNCIYEIGISDVDKGNGSTRIVTEKAYNELREKQIEALQAYLNKKPLAATRG